MKTYVATASVDVELKYFKTTTKAEKGDVNLFGVYVEKYVDNILVDEGCSGSICEDEELIDEVIGKLSDGGVMPFDLGEVLDDMEFLHEGITTLG